MRSAAGVGLRQEGNSSIAGAPWRSAPSLPGGGGRRDAVVRGRQRLHGHGRVRQRRPAREGQRGAGGRQHRRQRRGDRRDRGRPRARSASRSTATTRRCADGTAGDHQADLAVGHRQPLHRPPPRARTAATRSRTAARSSPTRPRPRSSSTRSSRIFDEETRQGAARLRQGPGRHAARPRQGAARGHPLPEPGALDRQPPVRGADRGRARCSRSSWSTRRRSSTRWRAAART